MKHRCTVCKRYVSSEEVYRKLGITIVCSETCLSTMSTGGRRRPGVSDKQVLVDLKKKTSSKDIPDRLRERVLNRDYRRCRMCGTTSSTHLHHIVYRSGGGKHEERNLITLCLQDHEKVHSNKRYWQPLLQETLRFFYEDGVLASVPEVARWTED